MDADSMKAQLQEWCDSPAFLGRCVIWANEGAGNRTVMKFFTERYRYRIVMVAGHSPYLGGSAKLRAAVPGEIYLREHELPDGSFSVRTWLKILASILSTEAVAIPAPTLQHLPQR